MKVAGGNSTQENKILVEKVKVLFRLLPPMVIIVLLISLGVLYGLWDVVSHTALLIWISLTIFAAIVRFISITAFNRHFKEEHVHRYALYLIIGSAITGLVWGIGGVILFPSKQLEYQLFLTFVIVSMGAGSLSSLTTYLPVFFAYFPISLLPIGVMMLLEGNPIHLMLGLMTFAYVIALSYFATYINQTLTESLKLRFENIDLVEQLVEQKNEAEKANMAKSKFLAAASHDLRQPLHALTLFTSVLVETIQYPKVRRVVDQIKSSVDALQSLFNALLDISQLDAGVMKTEKTAFYLDALFKKLSNDFDSQAIEKGLHINWPGCSYTVYSDQTLLERIVRNYLSNAIRYTDKGEITVSCTANDKSVVISVTDTGRGIPDEEQQAIFSEFHQLSNPERDRGKGLGLGLAIVQRTASLLGHPIKVESQFEKGSTFSITVEKADIDRQANFISSVNDLTNTPIEGAFILVIDDESSVREGMKNLLTMWGCEVITAADKTEALTRISQQKRMPDGIIADYRLRENQTGIDVIHAIHAKCKNNIPALIVTGDIAVERLREVNSSGFQMLHKPVAPIKLRTFLRHVQLHNKT